MVYEVVYSFRRTRALAGWQQLARLVGHVADLDGCGLDVTSELLPRLSSAGAVPAAIGLTEFLYLYPADQPQ